jgi:hypothetical protein
LAGLGNIPKTRKKAPGRWKKGESGNPSGRPKFDPEIKKAFVNLAPVAYRRIQEILESKTSSEQAILRAAELCLAYAYGKPVQRVEATGEDGAPIRIIVTSEAGDGH